MRYKCIVSYDGTLFHGFQAQGDLRTVQTEIENVLSIIHKHPVTIYAAGRTDARVHAIGQVFHFDSEINMKEANMQNAINSRLPDDIYIKEVKTVNDDFHSRYHAKSKIYHYKISFGEYDPLQRNYCYHIPHYRKVDITKMMEASKIFIGVHDFKSFTKNHKITNTTREIYAINFSLKNDQLTIEFHGNGFLHNMVRILVAMMIEVGESNYSLEQLKSILEAKNRQLAPKIAPPNGLYLMEVKY